MDEVCKILLEVDAVNVVTVLKHLQSYKLRSKVSFQVQENFKCILSNNKVNGEVISWSQDPRSDKLLRRTIISSEFKEAPDNETLYERYQLLHGLSNGILMKDGIPFEYNLDLLNSISFKKGCYIGQELIARTKFKVSMIIKHWK